MELDEWLWKNRIKRIRMARDLGLHTNTIFTAARRIRTPSLFTALAIEKYTDGQVQLTELLSHKDQEKLQNIKKI